MQGSIAVICLPAPCMAILGLNGKYGDGLRSQEDHPEGRRHALRLQSGLLADTTQLSFYFVKVCMW